MSRRALILLAIGVAIVAFGAGLVLRGRTTSADGEEAALQRQETALPAALCHFEQLVRADKLAEAKNVFWDEVHFTAHVLAADLQRNDRVEAGRFLVAKGAVERDLATLAPGLKIDSLAFVTETRRAMGAARVPGRERSC